MTNLTQLIPALPKIEAAGGPKFSRLYNLGTGEVKVSMPYRDKDLMPVEGDVWGWNPQACEATVIAYAVALRGWFYINVGCCGLAPCSDGRWWFSIWKGGEKTTTTHDTLLAASAALILAVAERVGGGV